MHIWISVKPFVDRHHVDRRVSTLGSMVNIRQMTKKVFGVELPPICWFASIHPIAK